MLLEAQDAICEVSATMVLSTSEVQEFQHKVVFHHPFHIFQSLCDACMVLDLSHLCYVINGIIESDGVIFAFVSVPEPCAVIFLFVDRVDDRKRSDQLSHSFAVYP